MEIIKLNDKNKTIEEIDLNDKIISKMKYGVIRIVGEDYLREVTWDTYNYLKNLPNIRDKAKHQWQHNYKKVHSLICQ